jgi:hypothetical protein
MEDRFVDCVERIAPWALGGLVIATVAILWLYFAPAHLSPAPPVQDVPYPAIQNHGQG